MQWTQRQASRWLALTIIGGLVWFPLATAAGQTRDSTADRMIGMADDAMDRSSMDRVDAKISRHMHMSPHRAVTHADSAKARELVATIRKAIARYADTAAATAAGYSMFMPNVKNQPVYHFTNRWHALAEAAVSGNAGWNVAMGRWCSVRRVPLPLARPATPLEASFTSRSSAGWCT